MQLNEISLESLKRAVKSLTEATLLAKNDVVRDATIQRFEFTFELCWKTLKKYLQANNKFQSESIKEILRESGRQGLIANVEKWFSYLEARNLTSHTYNEITADKVYSLAFDFKNDAAKLLTSLELALD